MNRILLIALAFGSSNLAVGATPDAQEIVKECQRRMAVKSMRCEGVMKITNSRGVTREKRWLFRRMGHHDNSKSVVRFTEPASERGVSVLIINHPDRQSEEWLWIPATGRERRIISSSEMNRSLGIDFDLNELEEHDIRQYDYQVLAHLDVDGNSCWKIRAQAKPGTSAVASVSYLYIRDNDFALTKIEKYGARELISTLIFRDIQSIQGVPTPTTVDKVDALQHSRAVITLTNVVYNAAMQDDDFTLHAVREGR